MTQQLLQLLRRIHGRRAVVVELRDRLLELLLCNFQLFDLTLELICPNFLQYQVVFHLLHLAQLLFVTFCVQE